MSPLPLSRSIISASPDGRESLFFKIHREVTPKTPAGLDWKFFLMSARGWGNFFPFLFIFVLPEKGGSLLDRKPIHCLRKKLRMQPASPPRATMARAHHGQDGASLQAGPVQLRVKGSLGTGVVHAEGSMCLSPP